jgi:DNA-binding MarR family transcriptional regulator
MLQATRVDSIQNGQQLSDAEAAAYRALVRVIFATPRVVSAEVSGESALSLTDCFALEALAAAPGSRMRVRDLSASCGVSQSGTTRIVNRLARDGLIQRHACPGDGRGSLAVLTAAGRTSLAQARPAYLASIRRHIFDHVDDVGLESLTAAMDHIAESLLAADAAPHAPGVAADA